MSADLLRRAAETMRREATPFYDRVADLLEHRAARGWFGEDMDELAIAEAYLADPGDIPAGVS